MFAGFQVCRVFCTWIASDDLMVLCGPDIQWPLRILQGRATLLTRVCHCYGRFLVPGFGVLSRAGRRCLSFGFLLNLCLLHSKLTDIVFQAPVAFNTDRYFFIVLAY